MGKKWDRSKKIWAAVDNFGSSLARHPIVIYLLTGIGGAGVTVYVFTRNGGQDVVIGGFLCTVWALLLSVMIYRFAALDGKKSLAGQAEAKELLTRAHVLAEQSQTDAKQLLAKVEDLAMQLGELTRSPQFHGQYENNRGVPGSRMVARTGGNYVISLYGRPRFLLTRLTPYSAGDSPRDSLS